MKKVRFLLLFLVCVFALSLPVSAAADASVETMEVSMDVDQNGTALVDVFLQVELDKPMDRFSIALGPDVSGIRVEGYSSRVERDNGQKIVHITGENGLPASMDLRLSYTVRNTVQSDSDVQQFGVRLLGGIKGAAIEKFTAKVQMPAGFEAIPEFASGYHADGIDNYLDIQVTEGGLLTASTTSSLLAGETLDLKIDTPMGYFTLHNVAGRTLLVDQILMILLALFVLGYWWKVLRYPMAAVTPQSRPPMGVEPGTAAALITGQTPDLALMAMDWAANGYLRVVRQRGRKVVLIHQMPMGNERRPYEQEAFAKLFARRTEVACGTRLWFAARKILIQGARSYWQGRLYEKKPGRPGLLRGAAVLFCAVAALYFADRVLPSMYLRILFLALVTLAGICWGAALQYALKRLPMRRWKGPVLCLLLCIVLMVIAWNVTGYGASLLLALLLSVLTEIALLFGPRRRSSGAELLTELLGWRRYLRKLRPEDAKQLLQADPQYYYTALLYAEALGVGRKFSRVFDGIRLDECAFLEREGKPLPRNSVHFRAFFMGVLAIARGEWVEKRKKSAHRRPQHSRKRVKRVYQTVK